MNEVIYADRWLYSVLSADSTLTSLVSTRIYSYLAPDNAIHPLVIYAFQGGADVMAVGSLRIFNSGVYQIKAIATGLSMTGTIATIAHRLDTVLHRASGTVTGGVVWACVREQPLAYVESISGIRYNHLGGLYRVVVQAV